MNFLAHAFLAGTLSSDRVGGLMGDFVKGLLPAGLPLPLASGVALHRAIDSFADSHEAFRRSRSRVSTQRRRVSGILVDLFYDHLLARNWSNANPEPLEEFVAQLYQQTNEHLSSLPQSAQEMALLMQRHNWLVSYRQVEMIARTIDRMAIHRFTRANTLAGGIEEFLQDQEGFEEDFQRFLPDALEFTQAWRFNRALSSATKTPRG